MWVYTRVMKRSVCHCTNLRRVAQHVTHVYDEALAPCGLKLTQFGLLRNIEQLGEPNLMQLAKAMELDRSTLGRNVRVVARLGLVHLRGGDDERATVVELTRKGKEKLKQAVPRWEEAQLRIEKTLGPDGEASIRQLLEHISAINN